MSSLIEKSETAGILQPIGDELLRSTGGAAIEWFGEPPLLSTELTELPAT